MRRTLAARALGDNEWFVWQLIGLRAVSDAGEDLGVVRDVEEQPSSGRHRGQRRRGGTALSAGARVGALGRCRCWYRRGHAVARGRRIVRFDVVTIFPTVFPGPLGVGVVGRALDRGSIELHVHDLREHTDDRHRQVDDMQFGGGAAWCSSRADHPRGARVAR